MQFPDADCLFSSSQITDALDRMAEQLTLLLALDPEPLCLTLMQGGQMMASHLLARLQLSLETDFVQVSRYQGGLQPGQLVWRVRPQARLAQRTVVVLDDILDSGLTLQAVTDYLLQQGAAKVVLVVLCDKGRPDPAGVQRADICGLRAPDRYLFGFGMDYQGFWRHLPDIYALKA